MDCQNGCWGGYSITLFVVVLCCFPCTVDCLSLEIKDNQTEFTYQPGTPFYISFYLINSSKNEDTQMYVHKKGIEPSEESCKLVMTRISCKKKHGDCNCSVSFTDRPLVYILMRTFQMQDSGDWVLYVWNTDIRKTVHLRPSVSGQTRTTTSIVTTSTLPSTSLTTPTTPTLCFTCFLPLVSLWCLTSYRD